MPETAMEESSLMELGLRGRACIVTGASRGIGRQTALQLAAEGASLLLLARRADALEAVAQECGGAATLALDLTDLDAGERALSVCLERFGRIDALVNNAATTVTKPLEQLTDEDWQSQWELHVMAPMRLMRAAAPAMAERGWGRIVNVSSSSGKRPSARDVAYSVTKAAELSLSRAFADRYAGTGVLVNAIAPGPIAGELWMAPGGLGDQIAAASGITREQAVQRTAGRVPLGRFGTEPEIASVIVFLCSEAASFVTGAAWSVDGGIIPVIV
jgi:3-oxoacyl-[acyl-carrier protein] reductase